MDKMLLIHNNRHNYAAFPPNSQQFTVSSIKSPAQKNKPFWVFISFFDFNLSFICNGHLCSRAWRPYLGKEQSSYWMQVDRELCVRMNCIVVLWLSTWCIFVFKFANSVPGLKALKKKKISQHCIFSRIGSNICFFLFLYFIDKRVNILHVIPFYYWENNKDSSMLHLRQFLLIFLYFCQLVFKTTHKNKNIYKKNKTKTNKPKARASFCQWGKLRW